jgi:CHAD domain-containing protein
MSEQVAKPPSGKWIKGVSPKQRLFEAAHEILDARLKAVCHWLPLAAEKPEEDVEYVHQLRVASRRAVAAVRVFSDLIPTTSYQDIRTKLRQVRLAADAARNLDVLCGQILYCAEKEGNGCCATVLEEVKRRRQEAQQPIMTTYEKLCAENLDHQINTLLEEVRSRRKARARKRFGKQAPRYLKPVLTKFFRAANADVSSDEAFHDLRLRAKKLRYTMEILAAAFPQGFRKNLYPQLILLQDTMGAVNDHATSKALFGEWLLKSQDAEQRAFFRGILFAEERVHQDLRQAFLSLWTPKTIAKLKREFRRYSGVP